jgi:hypothetical protein
MTAHTEDTLGSARIAQILNLPFAVATAEAARTEGLVAGEDGQVFDLVAASIAAICTVVADEGAVAEEEQVGVGVKQGAAGVTSEAVDVPSVAGCEGGRVRQLLVNGMSVRTYQAQKPCLLPESAQDSVSSQWPCVSSSVDWRTSPQPLQG